jgi:energy-converting hydrogenase Eha subunit G
MYNVNKSILKHLSINLANGKNFAGGAFQYSAAGLSCAGYASRALWLAGIPNIGIHPYIWQLSLAIRQTGILMNPF